MKKKLIMIVLFLIVFIPMGVKAEEYPAIHGEYGIAIDARSGEVLYEKNAKEKAYPASITKMITAMLLEEHVEDGEILTASEKAVGQEASNAHFKLTAGEKISKEDALYSLMLISSNDVAFTIAEHIAGSQEEFAKMMTERAKEIGAKNTNFVTPNGLHDPNHYTTAYDMALIAKEVLHHPEVLKVMSTDSTTIETDQREVEITNPSKIHDNPIAIGGKTGYTNAAQNTLVEILEKDDKLVIAVVMKTTLAEEYKDIEIMGDYAFDHMNPYKKVMGKGELVLSKSVKKQELNYVTSEDIYVPYKQGKEPEFTKNIVEFDLENKSVHKGEVIGEMEILLDGKVIHKSTLISDKEINPTVKKEEKTKENKTESEKNEDSFSFFNLIISILIPFVLYFAFIVFYNKKKRMEAQQKRH